MQDISPLWFFAIHHVIEILKAILGWLTQTTLPVSHTHFKSALEWNLPSIWLLTKCRTLEDLTAQQFKKLPELFFSTGCILLFEHFTKPVPPDSWHQTPGPQILYDLGPWMQSFLYSIELSKEYQKCKCGQMSWWIFSIFSFLSLFEPPVHSQVSLATRCCW